jgi:hypothetical protein
MFLEALASRTMLPRCVPPVQCFFELEAYQEEGRARLSDGLDYFVQIFHSRLV